MKNIKIEFSFDGQNYYGMQVQKGKVTIQGEIERALFELFNEKINLIYSGRTDRGVSAERMVANFFVNTKISPTHISYALNQHLPSDIRILKSCEVSENFNSRHSAKNKTYCYSLYVNDIELPMEKFSTRFKRQLDYKKMKKAIKFLKGTHDFTSFVTSSCEIEDKVRIISKAYIKTYCKNGINHFDFYFTGNGFLYNQVRIMVGTLIMVGIRKITPKEFKEILYSHDRKRAGSVMPAEGLRLINIDYK